MYWTTNVVLFALVADVIAHPTLPGTVHAQLGERAACTFTTAAAVASGKKSCSTITLNNIAVPAGQTLDLTGLNKGTHVIFQGTTSFGYKEWTGPLISVSGTSVTVSGATGHVIDGNGAKWWDGKGGNGGKTKPKFFKAGKLQDSSISQLNIKNTPVQGFSISGSTNLVLDHITIDNSAGDTAGGHNTDAFDVGTSAGIIISNAIVKNQDDCLAVNSGSNITFIGGSCSGGHGLSIGSVGGRDDNVVSNVHIQDSTISNSQNGVRIKTVYKATGSVSGITYSNIQLTNISKYGIVIEQDYKNGSPTGTPTNGVPITDLVLAGVSGNVASGATPVYILCAKGACSNWHWTGVKPRAETESPISLVAGKSIYGHWAAWSGLACFSWLVAQNTSRPRKLQNFQGSRSTSVYRRRRHPHGNTSSDLNIRASGTSSNSSYHNARATCSSVASLVSYHTATADQEEEEAIEDSEAADSVVHPASAIKSDPLSPTSTASATTTSSANRPRSHLCKYHLDSATCPFSHDFPAVRTAAFVSARRHAFDAETLVRKGRAMRTQRLGDGKVDVWVRGRMEQEEGTDGDREMKKFIVGGSSEARRMWAREHVDGPRGVCKKCGPGPTPEIGPIGILQRAESEEGWEGARMLIEESRERWRLQQRAREHQQQ